MKKEKKPTCRNETLQKIGEDLAKLNTIELVIAATYIEGMAARYYTETASQTSAG